jgi:hypothetical protein
MLFIANSFFLVSSVYDNERTFHDHPVGFRSDHLFYYLNSSVFKIFTRHMKSIICDNKNIYSLKVRSHWLAKKLYFL